MNKKILVATTNKGKMAELTAMLDVDCQWLSLADFPDVEEVLEDGLTFAENAQKKALGYARATGCWTIADDSGLVVDALDGAPGIMSARFAGMPEKDMAPISLDDRNTARVLELMKNIPAENRTARFVCCLCLASPEKILLQTEGKLEGRITTEKKGRSGFGYDPIVFVPELNKTVAELTAAEKNAISHRGNAIRKLQPLLLDILDKPG